MIQMPALYTWGLVFQGEENVVAMFNMPKTEAEKIEAASGGTLIARALSTSKYIPGRRKLPGHKIHAA
jgi:hypothetical protein